MATPLELEFADSASREHDFVQNEKLDISMGPSHPSTHGVLRLQLEVDGEIVSKCTPVIGYLHRGDDKLAENMTYNQFVPFTDRMDYLAPICNNVAYALAVEKLADLAVPARCAALRVLTCELSRISSHLLGLGVYAMDVGAMTVFLTTYTERERIYSLFEELTGARLTNSYTRIGGVTRDVPEGWLKKTEIACDKILKGVDEMDALLTRNKIFIDRTKGVGVITKDLALRSGLTGVNLRCTGVESDIRKDRPYSGYEQYDFDVPVTTTGDCYDRYLLKTEEIRQSVRIVKQVCKTLPDGPIVAQDAKDIVLPPKARVLNGIEELIQNFMISTHGPKIPAGEVYFEAENPKGALGFFIHSKGEGHPYRLHVRGPSFISLSTLPELVPGHFVSDIPAILGSLDFVQGECDR